MKKIIGTVIMVAILATAGLAMAQGCGKCSGMGMDYGPHSGGAHSRGHDLWGALNLTPEQAQQMGALREGFFKETLPLRNDLMSKKLELRSLWLQPNLDEEKILAKQKEISALKAQLQEKGTKNRLEMRKILTPEQQAQLASLRGRAWGEYGRGCGFGPGPRSGRGMGMGMESGPRW
jgi:Spy/CpxP family protein refolding chaperone